MTVLHTLADDLRERVPERKAGARQRGTSTTGALQQPRPRLQIPAVVEHARQPVRDQACACERVLVGVRMMPLDVERLRAVPERVHRRPAGGAMRQVERQPRLVDDAVEPGAATTATRPPLRVADAEVRRPLRTRVRRRHRDEREPGRGRRGLGSVDRAAAADGDDAVDTLWHLDPMGRDLGPARGRRQSDLVPARARHQERPLRRELGERV
jgi:hypothetical protein